MNEVKVSIIIPVYKAEKYISRCLDSVIHQTCGEYEVIAIDDGTPDDSGKICDAYAEKYPVLKVFHQKNIGVTRTREVGITKARGEYIVWVDSDDFATPELVESVIQVVDTSHADIILYGVKSYGNGQAVNVQIPRKEPMREIRRKAITGEYSTLWRFAVRRSFWVDEKAPGEMERSAADGYMAIRMFMKTETVDVVEKPLYNYLDDNPGSIRHTFNGKRYMGNFYLWYYRLHICEKEFKDLCLHCASRAFSGAVKAYSMSLVLNDLPEEYCEELVEAIRYLKKYPIPGRWRDKFLGWCILHHIEGPCKRYALHKIEKTKKLNNKSKMKS